MALSNLPVFPQKVQAWVQSIANADGTTVKTLASAGSNGSIVESINVSTTDTAADTFVVWMNNGTAIFLMCTVNIPITAGDSTGVAAVDILRSGLMPGLPVDANGNFVVYVPSGWSLQIQSQAAVTAGKTIYAVAMGADY